MEFWIVWCFWIFILMSSNNSVGDTAGEESEVEELEIRIGDLETLAAALGSLI